MSILPAPGPCLHENSKPIETGEDGWSEPSSQPGFSDCLPALERPNLFIDQLQIQNPSLAAFKQITQNSDEGRGLQKAQIDTGWIVDGADLQSKA